MSYMDVDTVADELYGLRPDEFTETRNERAKQARSHDQPARAKEIGRLRKPTASAWVVNLLARDAAREMDQLSRLGEQLREAQEELKGEELRELTQRRSRVVSALASRGRELARDAGHPVSESVGREVEGTLEAALADPEAAETVRSGRLTTALTYSGLGPVATGGAGSDQSTKGAARPATGRSSGKSPARARRAPDSDTEREAASKRAEVDEAQRSLSDAQQDARRVEQAHEEATDDERDARSRKAAADERVEQLERELEQARHAAGEADQEVERAARRSEDAGRDLRAASQRVDEARARLDRLR